MKPGRFQHFVAIDWSGAKAERLSGIAVAVCAAGSEAPVLLRPGHRWSRQEVFDWLLSDALPAEALIGMDLSPALPFIDAGGYFPQWSDSPRDAKALWRLVDDIAGDDPHLAANSFLAHPEARRHFRHGQGICGDLFGGGIGRMRRTEQRQRLHHLSPSSCFNLVGAAQVGKSSLTGMRLLHRLGGRIPAWPFDPPGARGPVIVEIYTSLAARTANIRAGRSKMRDGAALDAALHQLGTASHAPLNRYDDHATDAMLTSAWLRRAAGQAELWSPDGLAEVAQTEGWTFGVR